MATTARRRTPGLRREEVASLTGVSVDYYGRLEQGRGPHPSTAVLSCLARALRLTADERDHLFLLAEAPLPARSTSGSAHVRPGVLYLLDRLSDCAAMVISDTGDILAQTPLSYALHGDHGTPGSPESNLFRSIFLSGRPSRLPPEDRERNARAHVADLRATVARRPDDPRLNSLVAELRQGSELFARLWATHDVAVRLSDRKRLDHPVVGMLELDCEVLLTPEHDQRLIVHTASAGSVTAQRLDLLRVLGLQEMAGAAGSEPVDLNHVADRAASSPVG
jgi:transcriptional regulator with XRE-family HTH domain